MPALKVDLLSECSTGRIYFYFEVKGKRKSRREEISFYLTKSDVKKIDEHLVSEFVLKAAKELANNIETRKSLHRALECRRKEMKNPNVFRALKIFDSDGLINDAIDWETLNGSQHGGPKVPINTVFYPDCVAAYSPVQNFQIGCESKLTYLHTSDT